MSLLAKLIANVEKVIVGKNEPIKLAITCLLAKGHLLIEDIPGTGKTTLAIAIARSINVSFNRIQFTADLLPTDITGLSLFNQEKKSFEFHRGPIFSNIVLADEINRGTPRVQSGLLEAMNESQVTVDGTSYDLKPPFLVIATQNPFTFSGTYPLLMAQLDRFLVRISLGYLTPKEEVAMLQDHQKTHPLDTLKTVMSAEEFLSLQEKVKDVVVDKSIYEYIVALTSSTRNAQQIQYGVSHRGTIAFFNAVRAYALVCGRDYVLPDDVKKLMVPTLAHRIFASTNQHDHEYATKLLEAIVRDTPVPM